MYINVTGNIRINEAETELNGEIDKTTLIVRALNLPSVSN